MESEEKNKTNFVEEYVRYASQCTDAPEDYHRYIAYCLLSAIIQRKMLVDFSFGTIHPNIWLILLGLSGIAKKTTSIKLGLKLLPDDVNQLAQDNTPEGLIQSLSEIPVGILARDEIGGFLQNLNKKYMSGCKEFLNNLYDCPEKYTRRLREEPIRLRNVYVVILGGTTPKRFLMNTQIEDVLSGFYTRFIYINPRLNLSEEYRPVTHKKVKLGTEESILKKILIALSASINKIKKPVSLTLSDDALKRYNDWLKEKQKILCSEENVDMLSSVYSRTYEYAIKFAILEHINNSLNSYNSSFVKFGKDITLEEVEKGIGLAEKCLAYSKELLSEIVEGTELTNQRISKGIERVSRMIKRKPGITRSELLKNTNILAREMEEIINTLHLRNEIDIKLDGEGKKKSSGYYPKSEEGGCAAALKVIKHERCPRKNLQREEKRRVDGNTSR